VDDNLPDLPLGGLSSAISAQAFRACALRVDNKVVCWGPNDLGQLGVGDQIDRASQAPGQTRWPEVLLDVDGSLADRVLQVSAGSYHTCVLFNGRGIKCWGGGLAGALGLGDTLNRGTAVGQMGTALPFVTLE